jgi:hypothetical protein
MDSFALSFELTEGVGWAHAKVSVGATTHETDVSDLTRDPLGSLAQTLIAYVWPEDATFFVIGKREAKVDTEELRTRDFTWEDEPGGWRWILRPYRSDAVKVRIEKRSSGAGENLLIDSICSLQEMARACVNCIEDLLLKHGIVGYRLKWQRGDLPLSQYLLLKRWLESPQYDPRSTESGTWNNDVAMLRLLKV